MVLSENRVPFKSTSYSAFPLLKLQFGGTAPFSGKPSADSSAKSLMLFPSALGKVLTRQLLETIGALPGSWDRMDQMDQNGPSWDFSNKQVLYPFFVCGIPGIPWKWEEQVPKTSKNCRVCNFDQVESAKGVLPDEDFRPKLEIYFQYGNLEAGKPW